jgi:polar amino acid transport system substrate-binding protein
MSEHRLGAAGIRFAFLIEPPFCYRASDGAVTGCDVEVARHCLHAVGVETIVFLETEFPELLPGLADGRWDMTTGLFVTDERRRLADFSRPIWALPDGLLVRSDNPHEIVGYGTFARAHPLRLAVVRDQVQHRTALRLGVGQDQIHLFETFAEATAAVAAGMVDAYASVAMAHRGFLSLNPSSPLTVIEIPNSEKASEQGAFAFSKSKSELGRAVDKVLAAYLGSADHRALMARFGFT